MVKIVIHHGRRVEFLKSDYIGGQISDLGDLDPDYISVTHLWTLLKTSMNYADAVELWCKLERDDSQSDLTPLKCDTDVLTTVARILLEGRDTLRIYVQHDRSMTDMGVDAKDIVREAEDVHVNVEDIMRDAEGVNSEGEAVDSDDDIGGDNIEVDVSDFDESDVDYELYEYAVYVNLRIKATQEGGELGFKTFSKLTL
ncbi:hypothetical protein CJ030_MR2G018479 [Morella rubra]|uniref:PB1-like domain-containing protein n=1 Tax=Morella rubra TaxID=262757 RepID=A0A6A1WDK7_9ROSI|nr:hypothetical protein CJ030_MR2G018479 [Morella rubra]